MKSRFNPYDFNNMRNARDKYVWGIFYYNPQDPRIILPKRIPWMGWTLNFANLWSYIIILGIIACAVLIGYLEN